jgi:hypothetical protein
MKTRPTALAISVLLVFTADLPRASALITQSVEPDNYAAGTVLNNVNPYVSLITVDSSNLPHAPAPFDITAATASAGQSSTGSLVFAHAGVNFFYTDRRMRMTFAELTSELSLDFIAGFGALSSIGVLQYYDQSNSLLGTYSTGLLAPFTIQTMSVSRLAPDIKWAVAYTAPSSPDQSGKLDNLRFTSVPEPSTYALLAMTAASALWWARRRRRW